MRTWIQSQRYSSDAFRTSAPGSSPASQRIWKAAQLLRPRGELGDRARTQVVAVAEPAGDDRGVEATQVALRVPHDLGLDALDERERVLEVTLAPGSGI